MMWNHSKGQKREPELAIMEGRGILVKTKRRSVGKAGLRVTILVADGLSARQDHSPYVKKYFEKVTVTVRSVNLHKLV